MSWKKLVGVIDRVGQSLGFWIPLIIASVGGSLAVLAVLTKAFAQWAPFSYGLAFWLGVGTTIWVVVAARKLVPKRESEAVRLGRQASAHGHAIFEAFRNEQMWGSSPMGGISPTVYLKSIAFTVQLEKAGFPVPQLREDAEPREVLEMLGGYFGLIGPLLLQGDVAEAKEAAAQMAHSQ